MYAYNQVDQQLIDERVEQFRQQTARYLAGELDEEVFKQLRLRNGLYIQRHAPILRLLESRRMSWKTPACGAS
jgi:sulfite reductase (NADPH) hemoprotein beta-component